MSSLLSKLGSLFLVVVVTVAGVEVLLRVFDPIGIAYFEEINRYFNEVKKDDRFAYIHPSNHESEYQGVPVVTNSHGFRGPEFSVSKPADTKRIMILGDSVVFGWGVPYEDTFPAQLQGLLDEQGKGMEVISLGVCSWNTRTEYEFLSSIGAGYDPDVLVLVITGNDTEIKREGRTEISRDEISSQKKKKTFLQNATEDAHRFLVKKTYVASYINYLWNRFLGADAHLDADKSSLGWKDAELALNRIIELTRDRGIDLVAFLYRSDSDPQSEGVLALYEQYLKSENVPMIYVSDRVLKNPSYKNSFVDGHPNTVGHQVIAEKLLVDLKPWLASEPVSSNPEKP